MSSNLSQMPTIMYLPYAAATILVTGLTVSSAHAESRMVEVNGHRIHVDIIEPLRRNPALPTLVFESGLGDVGTDTWLRVIPLLPHVVRVIRYDRPGLGDSESDDQLPTPRHIAAVLHETLEKSGARPPYVLVGISLGGPRIRLFAAMYPDEVAGMVLVDPTDFTFTPEDELREVYEPLGWTRDEPDERAIQESLAGVPTSIRAEIDVADSMAKTGYAEFRVLPELHDIPVVVLAGTSDSEWPRLRPIQADHDTLFRQWIKVRLASLSRWVSRVPEGTFVSTPNSSHAILGSEPELVVWAVDRAIYPSIFRRLERAFTAGGVERLARECQAVKAYYPKNSFNEEAVHYLAIRFMVHNKAAGMALLEMNARDHPASSRAYERLGAGYAADGKQDLAAKNYQRALALDPKNEAARRALVALRPRR
jgi:pimeloyl-ACP methyl ester carboxylesterase